MFKHSTRVTAGILSAAVVASLVVFPQLSHAQATTDSTSALASASQQVMQEVQHYNETHRDAIAKAEKLAQTSVSAQDVSTAPVEYKGSVAHGETHIYFFTVAAGNSTNVSIQGDTACDVCFITDVNGGRYNNGDVLPAGSYEFVLSSYVKSFDYDVTISGVSFAGVPDNTLPAYNLTSPTQQETILPLGTQTFTVTGTTDATQAELDFAGMKQPLGPTFSVDIPLKAGDNYGFGYYRFFKDDGNGVEYSSANYDLYVKNITRIAGTDRFQGSALVSDRMTFGTVVIANGMSFPDGLSGAALASSEGLYGESAPILLTKASGLSVDVINEIKKKKYVHQAIILGGTGVVSTNVEAQLKALGIKQISRIAGSDRYATSAAVAAQVKGFTGEEGEIPIDTAIIVNGQGFPDALSASSPSAYYRFPILLVKPGEIPAPIQQYITSHNIKKFIIVGGTGVVSTTVEDQLVKIAGSANNVTRLYGQNRYQTSVEVAKYFYGANPWTTVIASGANFPDALAGGPFAAGGPILLTSPPALPTETFDYLTNAKPNSDYILGGTGAVSTNVEQQLEALMQ